MTDRLAPPAPASHDRSVPTGILEESAASLFEAMQAARDAEAADDEAPKRFYRALATATLLLPVPPGTQEEARRSLATAVTDQEEVEIGVMLARDSAGQPVSVVFASGAALAAWSPSGTGSIALPARIVLQNLADSGLPAILDPAGPIPYRFEPDELRALAAGRIPRTDEPITSEPAARSVRLRLPGVEAEGLEKALAPALARTAVREAYLVESDGRQGRHLVLGLVCERGRSPERDLPELAGALEHRSEAVDVVLLEEPMLSDVRQLTEPFYRQRRGAR